MPRTLNKTILKETKDFSDSLQLDTEAKQTLAFWLFTEERTLSLYLSSYTSSLLKKEAKTFRDSLQLDTEAKQTLAFWLFTEDRTRFCHCEKLIL